MLVRIRTNQEKILYNIKKSISYQNKHHRLPHTILPQIHIAENGNTLDQPQTLHSDEHAKILNLHREHYNSSNRIACYLIDNFKTTILRIINKYKICKVFDIGCGDGHISLFLAQHGYIVEGGDINEILIRQANLDVIEKNLYDNAKFNIIDIFNFDFSSIKSEIVLCSEVLEHLDNVDDAVDKIYKIQADLFLFSVPTEPLWRILNMARLKYLKNFGNTPGHVNHWGYGEFKRFLERKFVILEYIFVIPWSIALCKKK
jgi:SAM-dependent methyltransferase